MTPLYVRLCIAARGGPLLFLMLVRLMIAWKLIELMRKMTVMGL